MNRIVYVLGAGFSAPLGLPVISDFMHKARAQLDSAPERFGNIARVTSEVKEMAIAKNYMDLDLFNIEEILSLLEMRRSTKGKRLSAAFKQFVVDVIEHHTPPLELEDHFGSASPVNLLGKLPDWKRYVAFVAHLFNLKITSPKEPPEFASLVSRAVPTIEYCIITLNYDLVLETAWEYLRANFPPEQGAPSLPPLRIAKLHGSVDGTIVPPTWRKSGPAKVSEAWQHAREWLSTANELRILGYSFTPTDVYVKYLLSTAMIDDPPLQQIDVICRDTTGVVRRRYSEMIKFPRFRYSNGDISDYLGPLMTVGNSQRPFKTQFRGLETYHEEFMFRNP